ncbi:unnamed protein product [Closterium sp. NIES-65]|nr:unnamed protein product [Closterium sp. NIES-65]
MKRGPPWPRRIGYFDARGAAAHNGRTTKSSRARDGTGSDPSPAQPQPQNQRSYFDAPLPNLPCWPAPSANAAAFAATGGARRAVQSSAAGTAAGSAESAQQGTVSVGVDVEEGEDGGHVGPMMSRQLLRTARGGELSDDEEEVDGIAAIPKIRRVPEQEQRMLAAVDMGTNSFHMVVVKADNKGRFEIEDVEKEDVRLGMRQAEERALAAVRRLKQIAKTRGAAMRVVATSAVREARNRRSFVRRVLDTTGIDVEVLSGQEEACLIYLGPPSDLKKVLTVDIGGVIEEVADCGHWRRVINSYTHSLTFSYSLFLPFHHLSPPGPPSVSQDVYHKTVLTVDIGGGSTEFVIGREGKPLFATSLKLGHIRLTEKFASGGLSKSQQILEMRRYVRVLLADSGVLEAVLRRLADLKDREFTLEELSAVVKKICKAKTPDARAKLPGLPEKRADVILGGAILLEEIFLAMGIEKMRVSPYALREGVIVDTLSRTFTDFSITPDLRRSSVLKMAGKFNTGLRKESAKHCARLAQQILAGMQTCKMGGSDCVSPMMALLDGNDFEVLEAATVLHYVGMFISHKGYHKHSYYLIKLFPTLPLLAALLTPTLPLLAARPTRTTPPPLPPLRPSPFRRTPAFGAAAGVLTHGSREQLLGYSPMEVEMIALLVRHHRKRPPSTKDEDFAKLPPVVQQKIRALCAIMRIAVALDRCYTGAAASVLVLQDDDSCVLAVTPAVDPLTGAAQDVSLEMWAARGELEYFHKILKKAQSIAIADDLDADPLLAEPAKRGAFPVGSKVPPVLPPATHALQIFKKAPSIVIADDLDTDLLLAEQSRSLSS